MSQTLNVKIKGLFTSFNELSEVPEGALLVADNIDIIQDSIAQPRRGFDRETGAYSTSTNRTDAITEYQTVKIAHHGDTLGSATTLSYLSGGSWTSIESISAISGKRLKFAGLNQNLYYTSSSGIRALSAYNGTPRAAGGLKALDITASESATAASITTTANDIVAYRVVWLYRDSNDNLIFGAPSQREEYVFADETKGVDLDITIPAAATTSWYVQVYRSAAVATGGTPSDELGLVYEAQPTSGEISAKSMTITDIVPSALRGATIYTAASQEGLAAQNEAPPLCEDICFFQNSLFFAVTSSIQRYNLTLIAVGGSAGLAVDDTLVLDGITFTGKSSETVASNQFKVFTSGTPSENIEDTARSLVRVINQSSTSTVYAYYLSGPDDLPGMLLIEARSLGDDAFTVTSSVATCWSPVDIPTSGTAQQSSSDEAVNGLAWSKPLQPEAVPLTNYQEVGSKNDRILRIIALRDAVYIFKAGGEVYKLSGYYPNYQIDKVEDSVKLIAAESAKVLNNQIYCLTDQGVVSVGDSTKVLSRPIEQDLLSLVNQNYDLVQDTAFGVAYEADRKYYLFLPSSSADTYPTQSYVYNIFTNTWVRHTVPASCGYVDDSNNFYLGDPSSEYLLKERKNYSFLDQVDYGFATSISDITSTTITLASGVDNVSAGDILFQSTSLFASVESVDPATQTVTIVSDPGLSASSVTVLKGIDVQITWVPITFANPGLQKQCHTLSMLFKSDFFGTSYVGFVTDQDLAEDQVTLEGRGIGLWGLFPWGEESWGGSSYKRPLRIWVPRAKQRCSQLTVSFYHTWGYSSWQLVGLTAFGEFGNEDVGRD